MNVDSSMDRVQVYLPVPSEWPSQRNIVIEKIEPNPTSMNEDPIYGNKMAHFLVRDMPKRASLNFTIQYTFTFHQTHIQVDPARVGNYNMSDSEYAKYSLHRPAEEVESDDPIIMSAVREIVGEETNPYLKAKRIYDWIVANVEYRFPSRWGAKETYLRRSGDCGKYTALFCAMCISQGIPARPVAGLAFSGPYPHTYRSKGNPSDPAAYGGHVYAEFYVPSYGWIPVDASYGRGSGRSERYFGETWDPFLVNSKGYGIKTVPPVGEKLTVLQHYAWWFSGEAASHDSYYTYTVEQVDVHETTAEVTKATTITTATSNVPVTDTLAWKFGYAIGILLIPASIIAAAGLAVFATRRYRRRPKASCSGSVCSAGKAGGIDDR